MSDENELKQGVFMGSVEEMKEYLKKKNFLLQKIENEDEVESVLCFLQKKEESLDGQVSILSSFIREYELVESKKDVIAFARNKKEIILKVLDGIEDLEGFLNQELEDLSAIDLYSKGSAGKKYDLLMRDLELDESLMG